MPQKVDTGLLIHGVNCQQPLILISESVLQETNWKSGLKQVKLAFTGESCCCSHNFFEWLGMMEIVYLEQFLIYCWDLRLNMTLLEPNLIEYMTDPHNFTKLMNYSPQEYPNVCLCNYAIIICYYGREWLWYSASGDSNKRLRRGALFIANKSGVHLLWECCKRHAQLDSFLGIQSATTYMY